MICRFIQGCTLKISMASIVSVFLLTGAAFAQSPQLEEKLMALKQNQAINKQKLAQYIWTETNHQHQGRSKRHEGLSGPDGQRSAAEDRSQ